MNRVSALIAGAGARRLGVQLCLLAVAFSTLAEAAPRKPRSASLAQAAYGLAAGDAWGTLGRGRACDRDMQTLRWDAGAAASSVEGFPAIFAAALNAPAAPAKPGLRVDATVGEMSAKLCARSAGRVTGQLAMTVAWRISDPVQDRLLATVETHASGEIGEGAAGDIGPLLDAAFRGNAEALAADPAFQKALKPPPRPRAKPRPPEIEMPLAEMRLGLIGAAAPMALGRASDGVVSILNGGQFGSGVLITADGYLLTNDHVVGRSKTVIVRWPDGTETPGDVVRSQRRRDVALIKTAPPNVRPLAIRSRPVELAETVYAIGTPRETDFAGTLTRGVVSTARRVVDGQGFIQSDVAVTHGNSGGPLLDEKGWIVGLADLIYEPGGVSQNINFFLPIDEALKALAVKPPIGR